DPSLVPRGRANRERRRSGNRADHGFHQSGHGLVDCEVIRVRGPRLDPHQPGQQLGRGRQHGSWKSEPARAGNTGRYFRKICGRQVERDAAVAGAVVVAALVAGGGIAQQEGARMHHCDAGVPVVPERSFDHGRNHDLLTSLFERTIIRTGGAKVLAAAPLPPLTQEASNWSSAGMEAVVRSPGAKLAIFPNPWNWRSPHIAPPAKNQRRKAATMIAHVSIGVRDIAKAKAFYDAALKPIGYSCLSSSETSLGYGKDCVAFWVSASTSPVPPDPHSGLHFCFTAPAR